MSVSLIEIFMSNELYLSMVVPCTSALTFCRGAF